MSLPGGTVEASRAQRIERQQARYRDRGGIFKPAEHNPLLDLLLARGVNGESPSRTNSPHRSPSPSTSPRRKHFTSHLAHTLPTHSSKRTIPASKTRRVTNRKLTDPNPTVDHSQIAPDDTSVPGPSTAMDSAPSRNGRALKLSKNSTRSKPSARAPPSPDSFDSDSPPLVPARSNGRARKDASKSTKNKPSKPSQARTCKAPPQNSVPTSHNEVLADHEAPATSQKKVQKKMTSSKSKVAIVAKSMTETGGDEDAKPAPARSQFLESDSEQPPKRSTKGKLKAKPAREDVDFASQVSNDRATANTTKGTKIGTRAKKQSDTKDSTHAPEIGTQTLTSRETKKRKKPTATPISSDVASADRGAHRDSDTRKQTPQSRPPSPAPPPNEPARKRRKARQLIDDEGGKAMEERELLIQNRRPTQQLRNAEDIEETRKVSRSKARPIPMPNGVRLKPKPRPRLSMFQPPPDDEDGSDRDPIDFLS